MNVHILAFASKDSGSQIITGAFLLKILLEL